ncbi:fat storage-inducing transmembrane protein 1 [Brachionichthys hirsutus]|uniref:fat storage-inducing transmembrane protein 1 n=1 Tax=Brachionichthys hirsutus TaxID=412623 RepID=UPI0036051852
MDLKTGTSPNGSGHEMGLEAGPGTAAGLRSLLRLLDAALLLVTDVLARVFGSSPVRRHFHLLLSGMLLFGPVMSLWVSKYSIFANGNHYLYRKFLKSTWGWTCIFTGSFVVLLSISTRHPPSLSLRPLSRLAVVGLLWWGCRRLLGLLEDAAGACYEPVAPAEDVRGTASTARPLLLLHEGRTKAACLHADMLWRGYEVSQDVLVLCLCCLVLVEEMSAFGPQLDRWKSLRGPPAAPLRVTFLLCVLLLALWMFLLLCLLAYFPKLPSQQLGGALGYLGWRGLYRGWYRLKPSWSCPGPPGGGGA